ncbi:MAG: serine/threonine protein kinase [Pseudoxanthomonas sp.]|nr:serine/threonine protein kinase [Pseudoxanthomonas sp.]
METIMELDEMKSTWQALDRRLQQSNAIQLQLLRDGKLKQVRSSLRPLFWGQLLQIGFGAMFVLLAGSFWPEQLHAPLLLASGLILHLYGLACIITAGVTIGRIVQINSDYSAPVVQLQKRLAQVRRTYVLGGWVVGLPWTLLWIPLLAILLGQAGVDLWVYAPLWVLSCIAVGAVLLLMTWWFYRWSRHPSRARMAQSMDSMATGSSLRRAGKLVDDILRFERE